MTATTGERLLTDYLARLDAASLRLPPDRRAELREGIAEHVAEARAAGELRDETAVRTLLDRLGEPEEIVAAAGEDAPAGGGGGWDPPPWGAPGRPLAPAPPNTGLETAAVIMLTAGSLIPVVGWLVGVALLWSSRRWRIGEKLLGTLVVPGGPGSVLWLSGLTSGSEMCTTTVTSPGEGFVVEVPGEPPVGGPPPAQPPPPPVSEPQGVQETTVCESSGPLPDVDLPGWAVACLIAFALLAPIVVAVVLLRRARARAAAEPPVLRPAGASTWTAVEIAAVVILAIGSFVLPFVGSVVGLVLVWISPRWTTGEKALGTGLALLPLLLIGVLFVVTSVGGAGVGFASFGLLGLFIVAMFGPVIAAVYLAVVLSRRPVG